MFCWRCRYQKARTPPTDNDFYRNIFLESVAGVPGMVAGMLRHLHSMRRMKRDNGWIETLLEESYNERMHLLTFLKMAEPGPFMRVMVLGAQG
jgi:ubiquinol oxidase